MPHKCDACLVTCEDFRLHQRKDGRNYIANFIKSLNIDCDIITRGGAIQDLIRPKFDGFDDSLLRDAEVADRLHNAKIIILVNHEQCGAYIANFTFKSRQERLARHYKDLKQAKKILSQNFPKSEIKLYFAEFEEGSPDKYEIKEVK